MTVTEQAYAKLNFSLDIVGRRKDGYHLLQMVNQSIDLCDTLTLRHQDSGIAVTCSGASADVPQGEGNLVYRAAQAFLAYAGEQGRGVAIQVEKRIPSQAGLGGGSADAAAALRGLCRLFGQPLSDAELCQLAAPIGADVPFCVRGGTALVEGVGEQLHQLPPLAPCFLVVSKPSVGVSTKDAYAQVDRTPPPKREYARQVVAALAAGDLAGAARHFGNAFADVLRLPEVDALCALLKSDGALGASMSGSGSAVFGLFDNAEKARASYRRLHLNWPQTFLCAPCFP